MKERLELLEQENMQLRDELGSLSLHIEELQSALREIADMPDRSSGVRACIATARAALNPVETISPKTHPYGLMRFP